MLYCWNVFDSFELGTSWSFNIHAIYIAVHMLNDNFIDYRPIIQAAYICAYIISFFNKWYMGKIIY